MFTPEERQVFPLRRGGVDVHVDPMVAWRNLYRVLDGGDLDAIIKASDPRDEEGKPLALAGGDLLVSLDARETLARVARAAFGLEPVSPDGSAGDTESHAIGTLYRFFAWEADLKNGPGRTPSGSPASESSPAPSTT